MVQVTWSPGWITDSFFLRANPCVCKIQNVEVLNEEGRQEVLLHVTNGNDEAKMSVYSANLRILIAAFGADTDAWKGRVIKLSQTKDESGKRKRSISVPVETQS